MHILYTDQNNTFNCQLEIEGAEPSNSSTRLIVETKEGNSLLFFGTLKSNGECDIPLTNIKKFLKENETGKLQLEVIVDNNIFTPWKSDFFVKSSKKVTVTEVKSTPQSQTIPSSPVINVKVSTPKQEDIVDYHISQLNTLTESITGKTKNKDLTKVFEFYQRKKLTDTPTDTINLIKNKFIK